MALSDVFSFFFSQLFHLLYNTHVNGNNISCCGSGEQMCLLNLFFLPRHNFFFFFIFTALITCFAMLWPIFKVKLVINICFGEGGTTTFLRRLRPVRQQPSFQLDVKMQIIQASEYVKVRIERTLICSEIRLKSSYALIVLGQLCWLGMVWG